MSCAAPPHGLCFQQLKFLLLPFLFVFECLLFLVYLLGLHLGLFQGLFLPIFSPDMAPDASSLDSDPFTFVLVTCGKLCTSFLINGQPFSKPGWSGCPSLYLPLSHLSLSGSSKLWNSGGSSLLSSTAYSYLSLPHDPLVSPPASEHILYHLRCTPPLFITLTWFLSSP